jgi:hypothetical protein
MGNAPESMVDPNGTLAYDRDGTRNDVLTPNVRDYIAPIGGDAIGSISARGGSGGNGDIFLGTNDIATFYGAQAQSVFARLTGQSSTQGKGSTVKNLSSSIEAGVTPAEAVAMGALKGAEGNYYTWEQSDPNDLSSLYKRNLIMQSSGLEEESVWSKVWNSEIARWLVPDKMSISLGGDFGYILTAGAQPFNVTLLTRGKEPGIYMTPSANVNLGMTARVDGNINFSLSRFTGDPRSITSSMLTGHTLGVSGSITAIVGATASASYSPVDPAHPFGVGFVNVSFGLTGGAGASLSMQYQYTPSAGKIWEW